jgi:hypothetical protein
LGRLRRQRQRLSVLELTGWDEAPGLRIQAGGEL